MNSVEGARRLFWSVLFFGFLGGGCSDSTPPAGTSTSEEDSSFGFEFADVAQTRADTGQGGTGNPFGPTPDAAVPVEGDALEEDATDAVESESPDISEEFDTAIEEPDVEEEYPDSLSISVVTEGEILSGISPIAATVTGGEWILGVEFHVDGLKVDTDVVPPYTLALDTKAFKDGPHIIAVYTADSQGAYASATAEVLFDNSPPVFEELVPGENASVFFEDGPLSLGVTVDDPDKIVSLKFRVNGLLVGEFTKPPFQVTVKYEDIFVNEENLPKNLFVQVTATDVLDQVTDVSYDTQVFSRLRWKYDMVYEVKGSPDLLPNGNVVFGNSGGELYALTPDGDVAWQSTVSGQIKDGVRTDPETGNTFFGVIGEGNPIYGYNQNGGQLWSRTSVSPAAGRVAQVGGSVYTALFNGELLALNKNNGDMQWSVQLPENLVAAPAVTPNGRMYIGCWDNNFRAVESGSVLWDFGTGDEVRSTAAVGSNAVVYFGSNDGWIYAANEADGSHVWVKEVEGNIEGELLLVEEDSALYVASSNTYIHKMNMNTGEIIWKTKLDYIVDASPVMGPDGTLYLGSQTDENGKIFAVDSETGDIRFAYQVDAVVPDKVLLVDDKLYFGANNRSFYSIWAAHADLFVAEETP